MLNVLSVDVANKSLAVAFIKFDTKKYERIEQALDEFRTLKASGGAPSAVLCGFNALLDKITDIYNGAIDIKHIDVKDLIPGKKMSETDLLHRTVALHGYLSDLTSAVIPLVGADEEFKILIEYQMGPNEKSRAVSTQLMYHFAGVLLNMGRVPDGNIILVGPSLKNTIYIGAADAAHINFLEKYKTNYSTNKAHSRFNLVRLLQVLGKSNMLVPFAKKNYDDLGDAVMMAVAWVTKHYSE
jgi:hypothetical protein